MGRSASSISAGAASAPLASHVGACIDTSGFSFSSTCGPASGSATKASSISAGASSGILSAVGDRSSVTPRGVIASLVMPAPPLGPPFELTRNCSNFITAAETTLSSFSSAFSSGTELVSSLAESTGKTELGFALPDGEPEGDRLP